jgi:hypothetical protein
MARPVDGDGISQLSVALDENSLADRVENLNDLRFIISIDYGTTYTGTVIRNVSAPAPPPKKSENNKYTYYR